MSEPLKGTASAANAIARVNYSHDAMIDLIIARPGITQNELATHFGYSVGWVSRVQNSDAFQARLAVRKEDIVDPALIASTEERLRELANLSIDTVLEKVRLTKNADLALKAMEVTTKALGYGARNVSQNTQNNQFVVMMPGKAASAEEWAQANGGKPGTTTIIEAA